MAESTGAVGAAEAAVSAGADRVSDDLRSAAEQVLESQKQHLAALAHRLASALRRSAEAFAEEDGALVARYADRAAARAEQLSDRLGRQSWRDCLADIETAARRRPELFVAGAVAAGFVLVRLVASASSAGTGER